LFPEDKEWVTKIEQGTNDGRDHKKQEKGYRGKKDGYLAKDIMTRYHNPSYKAAINQNSGSLKKTNKAQRRFGHGYLIMAH